VKGGAKNYVVSRVLRIYPALCVNLIVVTFVLGSKVTTMSLTEYLTNQDVWIYFRGLALTYKPGFFLPGVFAQNHNQAVNGSIWSVLIEVWLYGLVVLFYTLGILRNKSTFNTVFFLLVVIVWNNKSHLPVLFNDTNLHVALLFYIGSFLYINRDCVPVSPYFALIALFLAGITLGTDRFPYGYMLLLVTFFCTVCFSKQFSWIATYGDYSYGTYLYGWPCQQLAAYAFPNFSGTQNLLAASAMALLCGVTSWHLIEKRALRLKKYFSENGQTQRSYPSCSAKG